MITYCVLVLGYMLKDASEFAWENGLTGLEFAGIPGTLGGAVFMNAGAMSHGGAAVIFKAISKNTMHRI